MTITRKPWAARPQESGKHVVSTIGRAVSMKLSIENGKRSDNAERYKR